MNNVAEQPLLERTELSEPTCYRVRTLKAGGLPGLTSDTQHMRIISHYGEVRRVANRRDDVIRLVDPHTGRLTGSHRTFIGSALRLMNGEEGGKIHRKS